MDRMINGKNGRDVEEDLEENGGEMREERQQRKDGGWGRGQNEGWRREKGEPEEREEGGSENE